MVDLRGGPDTRLRVLVRVPDEDRSELAAAVRDVLADPTRVTEVELVMARGVAVSDHDRGVATRGAVLALYLGVDPGRHAASTHGEGMVHASTSDPRDHGPWSALRDVARLCRHRSDWTRDEAVLLWWHATRFSGDRLGWWGWDDVLRAPLAAADAIASEDRAPLATAVEEMARRVAGEDESLTLPEDRRRLLRRLAALLPSTGDDLPPHLLAVADPFGALAREQLLVEIGARPTVAVVQHLATYAAGVRAPARWRRTTRELLSRDPAHAAAAVRLLELVAEHEGEALDDGEGGVFAESLVFVDESTVTLLRAAVWACGEILVGDVASSHDRDHVLDVLVRAAEHCGTVPGTTSFTRCPQVASSTVALLAELEPAEAAPALERLRGTIRNQALRKAIDQVTAKVADRAGVPVAQLVERTVPTFGLDASGRTEVEVGPATAVVVVTSPTRLAVRWVGRGDRLVSSPPAAVRDVAADDLAQLRARVRAASKVLAAQRDRLETMLATDTPWTGADWLAHCVGHPLIGRVAETLLWRARSSANTATGLPERAGGTWALVDVDGGRHPVGLGDEVRLWHPLLADTAEVLAWRERLVATETRQAFRQAFREIYVVTAAEERTETYSNRFAAHLLTYHRARALMRARGWSVGYLGDWDGGDEDDATRDLAGTGWRASYRHGLVGTADRIGPAELCATDRVFFSRAEGDGAPARIADVPPLVFSEAMRDVDLFVGVASIAADPTWADRGPDDVHAYWERESAAPLGQAASVRRETLARILPRTRIADRVDVGDLYLTVRGDVRTYRIHLGSGSVLMAPDDRFVCILEDGPTPNVFLPFEDDGGRLAQVLSKAFLLADDATITDPVILAQIQAGRVDG